MSISPFDLLNLTCRSLSAKPLRSVLTTVGVFMGVAAVSATLQVRSISQKVIAQQLAEQGAPQVTVYPEWEPGGADVDLTMEDLKFLRQRLSKLQAISAFNWAGPTPVLFQDKEVMPSMSPVSQDFLLTSGKALVQGRFFTASDFANYRRVAVIDKFLADKLFEKQNPLGQYIYARQKPYLVIGVIEAMVEEDTAPRGQVLVPISTYNAIRGDYGIGSIRMRPYNLEDLEDLSEQAEELLEERFPKQSFMVWNNVEQILQQQNILAMASRGLSVVAGISLLVGGIGIANITIASVAERTSEIGLRRSIGATQGEIMLQFILEATLLSLLGGTIALVAVHGLTTVIADTFELPYEFEIQTAGIALGSALLVGVGAGFYPALQASRLDPVQALRSQ